MTSRALASLIRATSATSLRTKPLRSEHLVSRFVLRSGPFSQKRTMSLTAIATPNAPSAVGPYSQAIKAGQLLFVSGCIPLDPMTMTRVQGGIKEEATQALANMKGIVEASGSTINHIAKCTVFLQSMNDFGAANEVYAEFFGEHRPARSCVEVAKLPLGVLFEIECIAVVPEGASGEGLKSNI